MLNCKSSFEHILCFSAGVPATHLHRYDSLGCIDVAAVLEPLGFVLPQRETTPPPPLPEVDIDAELSSLTFDSQLNEPTADQNPASTRSGPSDSEPEPGPELTEPTAEEQDDGTIQDEESNEHKN